MQSHEKYGLQALKDELEFLRHGGYDYIRGVSWRPALFFEDSPICARATATHPSDSLQPCFGCALFGFVPPNAQNEKSACRRIPLTTDGQTLHTLYCCNTAEEARAALDEWLVATIARLEALRTDLSFNLLQLTA
jgi:hypothetical protein